jgi:hypothetical protein
MPSKQRSVDSIVKWLLPICLSAWLVACTGNMASNIRREGDSTIVAGHARFEFLTPSLVRMEYSPTDAFVDSPTAVVQKRDWPKVQVVTSQEQGWLVVKTSAMTLRYRLQSGPFTATNLVTQWNGTSGGAAHAWHPGDVDAQNLGGLT